MSREVCSHGVLLEHPCYLCQLALPSPAPAPKDAMPITKFELRVRDEAIEEAAKVAHDFECMDALDFRIKYREVDCEPAIRALKSSSRRTTPPLDAEGIREWCEKYIDDESVSDIAGTYDDWVHTILDFARDFAARPQTERLREALKWALETLEYRLGWYRRGLEPKGFWCENCQIYDDVKEWKDFHHKSNCKYGIARAALAAPDTSK